MENNPTLWLQIELTKNKITPIYTIIEQIIGSHINSFKIQLKCNVYITVGEGKSKKEAKINAAIKMINLLYSNKNFKLLKNSNINEDKKENSFKISASNLSINYIGKLQELATLRSISLPNYIHKSTIGQSHKPVFTMICKYDNLEEEASGNTKKEAKSLAAQKMYNRISFNIETITSDLAQIQTNESDQLSAQNSMEMAIKSYLKLRKTTCNKNKENNKITYDERYRFWRDKYSCKDRESVMNILEHVIIMCKNEIFSIHTHKNTISNTMKQLTAALNILNIKIQKINYSASKTNIYNLQLNTTPIISEIAYGKSEKEAEINAIFHIAETIFIMLI